jgi:hypothetical protein
MAYANVRWTVTSRLDEIADHRLPRAVERKLERAAKKGESHAKRRTPVRTGESRASVESKVSGKTGTISIGTRGGHFAEVGYRGVKGKHMVWGGAQVIIAELVKGKLDVQ